MSSKPLTNFESRAVSASSSDSRLAIHGGSPLISTTYPSYRSIGIEEQQAAAEVLKSGVLSKFLGCWDPDFYGGVNIQNFEAAWSESFEVRHSVAVNSNTSGLIIALGAIGLEPGDEVIVSTWSMSASATSILIWNAIPVFADIEEETFNIDPKSIEANITSKTRAIMVPDIFGHAAQLDEIMAIAKRHNLKVIEDAAQAPWAEYRGKKVGTVADIGVFSLNYHKHIHTGEGGMCVTNDPELAERMQLIRNHAEAVVGDKGVTNLTNMIGFNFRMTEVAAAIGIQQLKKLPKLVRRKQEISDILTEKLKGLPGLRPPVVHPSCTHSYYFYPLLLDLDVVGVERAKIHEAVIAEGFPWLGQGYVNIHLLPMYQHKQAYGSSGFPWSASFSRQDIDYRKGICPVAERCHDATMMGIDVCGYVYTDEQISQVGEAFHKVWSNLDKLGKI